MVPCHRLDDVLPWASQRVGLLHLDVERHESEVVDGARAPRSHLEVVWCTRLGVGQILLNCNVFKR